MTFLGVRRNNNVLLFVAVVFIIFILYLTPRRKKPTPAIISENMVTKFHLPPLKLNPEYIINNFVIQPTLTLCENNFSPKIIWMIISHVANNDVRIKQRSTLRTADLEYHFNTTRIFLVGRVPPGDERRITQPELVDESVAYGDILQGNFTEDYKNLTHKHLMGLHWITTYCKDATFIIKTDDNYEFSMRSLNLILQNLRQKNVDKEMFLMGFIQDVPLKYRAALSRWYKKKGNAPPHSHYIPPYLPGWLYLTTPKVATMLTRQAMRLPYFWKDDVFVTGVLASELQIRLLELTQFH